jgi:nucleoside 2-deoxyribosyltransferase
MRSVYLAAQFARRDELRIHAAAIEAAGMTVTSRWLKQLTPLDGLAAHHSDAENKAFADTDLADVARADGVLFFAEDPLIGIPRGGRHVEFGYALALGKEIAVVGPRENVFHWLLPNSAVYSSVDEFLLPWNRCGHVYKPSASVKSR